MSEWSVTRQESDIMEKARDWGQDYLLVLSLTLSSGVTLSINPHLLASFSSSGKLEILCR